ncbi:hypothetical protein RF11_09088 [Thelohanellus kitauei]|uniref:Uncharacterized protein n=1 Tax=Thelohanellus kitauei TaxID=669202 RepID=A0A0C2MWD4_THEKT|nr:hypothetical protein RF11_09088 [Thelohanellus kitauei]
MSNVSKHTNPSENQIIVNRVLGSSCQLDPNNRNLCFESNITVRGSIIDLGDVIWLTRIDYAPFLEANKSIYKLVFERKLKRSSSIRFYKLAKKLLQKPRVNHQN